MIYLKDKPIIMIQRFQITQHIIKQEKEQTPTPKEQGGKKNWAVVATTATITCMFIPSTATYLVLASYHKCPSDFISSQQWVEVNMY